MRGEVKALPLSEKILILVPGSKVSLVWPDGVRRDATIRSIKKPGRHFVFSFFDVPDIEGASRLSGSSICVGRESVVLEKNEFFHDQIIGLSVFTTAGEMIGTVEEILETGGNDVYIVRMNGKEYLLPAVREIVREVDMDRGRIVIETMPGLLD